MGICPMDPELRVVRERNKVLLATLRAKLQDLKTYGFSARLHREVGNLQERYLFSPGILEDLQKLQSYLKSSVLYRDSNSTIQNLEQQLKNSCLILQNEANQIESPSKNEAPADSFHNNMQQNESLVVQINILYSTQLNKTLYSQSLRLFLKWAQMFQQHSYGGFLKPIYQHFCSYIYSLPLDDIPTIVDQVCIFVQFLVVIVTEVYSLELLATEECGKLIKNQNVYNLIMSIIFKRTKIRRFIIKCINFEDKNKIENLERQLNRYHRKPTYFFGISKKFTLQQASLTESQINKSIQQKGYVQPYVQSLKLVNEICKSGTPITKLKTIIAISKEIVKDIQRYYQPLQKQSPQLDPDNLSSIIMYLIVKNNNKSIYEQLKIVQYFTTTNCLNCISGYYLNVFNASIESILSLQEQ